MNSQAILQFFGILLAVSTAFGCIAYEKLVYAFSYTTVVMLVVCSYLPFFLISLMNNNQIISDLSKVKDDVTLRWSLFVFFLSGITSYCWYYVTKTKGVMAGSLFEVKYLLVLAIFYFFCGTNPMNANTIIGVIFSVLGIYFITR